MMYVVMIVIMGFGKGGLKVYFMKRNCGMRLSEFVQLVLVPISVVSFLAFFAGFIISYSFDTGWMRLGIVLLCEGIVFLISTWYFGMTGKERIAARNIVSQIKTFHI